MWLIKNLERIKFRQLPKLQQHVPLLKKLLCIPSSSWVLFIQALSYRTIIEKRKIWQFEYFWMFLIIQKSSKSKVWNANDANHIKKYHQHCYIFLKMHLSSIYGMTLDIWNTSKEIRSYSTSHSILYCFRTMRTTHT